MSKELMYNLLSLVSPEITEEQLAKFEAFYNELSSWNKRINLTSITDKEDVIIKHFYDSLLAIKTKEWKNKGTLLDLGSGAGLPGIPLKIINPEMEVVLLDSLKKRITFLQHVINILKMSDIKAEHGRAEEWGHKVNNRESFDFVVARAVSSLPVILEYCLPFVKKEGNFIAYKGPEGREEMKKAKRTLEILGGEITDVYDEMLPRENSCRLLIVIRKTRETPQKYPRRNGMPEKRPL